MIDSHLNSVNQPPKCPHGRSAGSVIYFLALLILAFRAGTYLYLRILYLFVRSSGLPITPGIRGTYSTILPKGPGPVIREYKKAS